MTTRTTLALAALLVGAAALLPAADPDPHPVTFSGGHDIGKDDHGRPCVLIAAALGVKTEDFRKAFSGVTPAKGGLPTPEHARKNKEALMKLLGPLGVTNDRLDEVSNYYRFQPQKGELWKHKEAAARAVVKDGAVTEVVVTDPGSGYTTPPKVAVKGVENVEFVVTLHFDKDLKKNGSVKSVEVKKK